MKIDNNILLAQYTTLKIGGPAKFFCEAKNEQEIQEAVKFAEEKNLPVFALGGGSNILVSDKGFDGLVIKILNSEWRFDLQNGDRISTVDCGAGCQLGTIVNESVKAGLSGMEWTAGIPGTIGGAVWGNAGAFGSSMSEIVETVKIIDTKKLYADNYKESGIMNYELGDCRFSYRDSIFRQNSDLIILSAMLKLKKGDKGEIEKIVKENLEKRKKLQPAIPCPGSFFKNPVAKNRKLIEEYEKDTGNKAKDNVIPAGYVIETLGLKGKKIGGAMVSDRHANFIVNTGKATAENIVILAAIIKTKVRNKFGIQLQEEVQMVGF
ncbi:MAG: UDP-N-acetylmuramate dehydrogenase [Patescibacteria group bacterium]|nr:UDP-N-acetylmuramate dehydrogenase [Patescibacteria group bacterium]